MLFTKVYALHYNNPLCNQLVLGASILDIAMRYIVLTLFMNHPKNNQNFVMLHTDGMFHSSMDGWARATD